MITLQLQAAKELNSTLLHEKTRDVHDHMRVNHELGMCSVV